MFRVPIINCANRIVDLASLDGGESLHEQPRDLHLLVVVRLRVPQLVLSLKFSLSLRKV